MGQLWKPNRACSIKLLLKIISASDQRILEEESDHERHRWIVFSSYIVITYVLSLRGSEGLLLDLKGTWDQWKKKN